MLRSSRNIFLTRKNIQKRKGGFTKKKIGIIFFTRKNIQKRERMKWPHGPLVRLKMEEKKTK